MGLPRPVVPAPRRGVIGGAVIGVLLASLIVPALTSGGLGASEAAAVTGDAALEVAVDGRWVRMAPGDRVPDGARVRATGSEVALEFRTGQAWLSPSAAAVLTRDRVELLRGEALISSGGDLGGRWQLADVSGAGVFRLTHGASPRLGVYRGAVAVQRPGEHVRVTAMRQLDLAARRLAAARDPLRYHPDDRWDQRLLAGAIAFDGEVSQLAGGLDRQYGTGEEAPAFYRTFAAVDDSTLPVLASTARNRTGDRFGPPSDALVTLFVSQAGAQQDGRRLGAVARTVAGWRADGARWGLVAEVLGIDTVAFGRVVAAGTALRITELALTTDSAAIGSIGSLGTPGEPATPTPVRSIQVAGAEVAAQTTSGILVASVDPVTQAPSGSPSGIRNPGTGGGSSTAADDNTAQAAPPAGTPVTAPTAPTAPTTPTPPAPEPTEVPLPESTPELETGPGDAEDAIEQASEDAEEADPDTEAVEDLIDSLLP